MDEWSARSRGLYLTTRSSHNIENIHASIGNRTRNSSKPASRRPTS
jgi:hypothetical protein